jgi:hypothetical protein
MMSADELIREAHYAFRNIGHSSTSENKYRARARKYAKQVIRKYPVSIEASQARRILDQLNVRVDTQLPSAVSPRQVAAADFEQSHSSASGHTKNITRTPLAGSNAEEWRKLVRRFADLSRNKKRFLGIIVFVAILFPGGIFGVGGLVIFYALQPALLKTHLGLLLNKLEAR